VVYKKKCRKKISGKRRCSNPSRICGFCTTHFIKSGFYKGKNTNIRRKKVFKRKR